MEGGKKEGMRGGEVVKGVVSCRKEEGGRRKETRGRVWDVFVDVVDVVDVERIELKKKNGGKGERGGEETRWYD